MGQAVLRRSLTHHASRITHHVVQALEALEDRGVGGDEVGGRLDDGGRTDPIVDAVVDRGVPTEADGQEDASAARPLLRFAAPERPVQQRGDDLEP
jgi:hypothetical protein